MFYSANHILCSIYKYLFIFHSEWNFFGYIAYPTAAVVAAVAQTFSFKGMGEALTEFAGTYAKHPSLKTGVESAVYNKIWWRIIIIHVIVLPAILCLGAFNAFYFLREEIPSSFQPYYGVIGLIQGQVFSLPSTSLGKFVNFFVILYLFSDINFPCFLRSHF